MADWIRDIPLLFAFWLGLMTAISPCPMATNVASISFLARRVDQPRQALAGGLLYTLGRMAAYLSLALLVVHGLLSIPGLAMFLQRDMGRIIGPLLILVALLLTGRLPFQLGGGGNDERARRIVERSGLVGAFLIGVLFALSFCPVSAALFFGSLIPLVLSSGIHWSGPLLFGFGTGLPVLVFALIIVFASHRLGRAFAMLTRIERWMRQLAILVFFLVGVWFTLTGTFGIPLSIW